MSYKYIAVGDVDYHNREYNYGCIYELSWDGHYYTCYTHKLSTTAERFNNFEYFVVNKNSGAVMAGFNFWASAFDYIADHSYQQVAEILDRDGGPVKS